MALRCVFLAARYLCALCLAAFIGVTTAPSEALAHKNVGSGSSSIPCNSYYEASIAYNYASKTVEFCNGTSWGNLLAAGSTDDAIDLGTSTIATNPSVVGDLTSGLFSGATSTVSIATGGVQQVTVNSGGNVGIGSTTPVVSLDISQKTDAIAVPVGTTGTEPSSPVNGMLRYNTTIADMEAYINGAWTSLTTGGDTNSMTLGTSLSATDPSRSGDRATGLFSPSVSTVAVATAGTQQVTINPTGVGIGLSSPTVALDMVGVLKETNNGIGAVVTPGAILQNTTAAAAGAQQYSPVLRWIGQGWKTTATAASLSLQWDAYILPAQSTITAGNGLTFLPTTNGVAASPITFCDVTVNSAGVSIQLDGLSGECATGVGHNGGSAGFGPVNGGNTFGVFNNNTGETANFNVNGMLFRNTTGIMFASGSPANASTGDVGMFRNAAGVMEINNSTAGQWGAIKLGTRDAGTVTVTNGLTIGHQSTGTPAAGLGSAILLNINDSTTADQNAAQIGALWTTATHGSTASALTVSTLTGGGSLTEQMRITGAGNVGIGTTTPQNKLDVYGAVAIGTTYAGVTAAPTNGMIVLGSVGIGTSAPNTTLEVDGNITLTSGSGQTITTPGSSLTFVQTGDTYGTTSLALQSRSGSAGALFSNAGLDLVDFGFHPMTGPQANLRLEHRSSYILSGNTTGEWQLINSSTGTSTFPFRIGDGTAYIEGNVGIGSTAPRAALDIESGGMLAVGTSGSTPVSGLGTRFMWIPAKGALRAGALDSGYPTRWDDANIGTNSIALGFDTQASGNYSVALGYAAYASGANAVALGNNAQATQQDAFAVGNSNRASGYQSVALGASTTASGQYSMSMGVYATASGNDSTAIGEYVTAGPATNSVVIGLGASYGSPLVNNVANSFAVGFNSTIPTLFVGPASGVGTVGNVGIGTTAPAEPLEIYSSGSGVLLQLAGSSGTCNHTPGSSSETVSCSSDMRMKTDTHDAASALPWLSSIRIRDFAWKPTGQKRTGVIAQELQKTHPEMVTYNKVADEWTVEQPNPWTLVKILQEQQDEIDDLKKQLAARHNER